MAVVRRAATRTRCPVSKLIRRASVELARREHALLGQDGLDGVEPALVVGRALVRVRRHALDPAAELVDVHGAASAESGDERVRQQLPVRELVLAPVDRRVGRPAAAVVNGAFHGPIVTGTALESGRELGVPDANRSAR